MLLNYEDISPVKKSIEVEIPAAAIAAETQRVTNEFGRQAKIPGFRPGKVPLSVVKNRFAKDIQEEVVNRLLPISFQQAVAEKGLVAVGEPHLDSLDPFVEGAPMKYKAQFEVKPQFELGNYQGLEVEDPQVTVADSDVDAMIERLRDQASAYRIETERPLADGDIAVIDISSSAEGIEPQSDGGHVKIGEETPLPELHDLLRGKKAGDTASFDKEYPEDAANELFRGRTIHHDVTVKEIRVQEKPEVNDEFATSVGNWESVAQMREQIGGDILRHRQMEAARMKRNQIGDRLLGLHDFEVPDSLTDDELGKSLQNYARYLASQGVDLDRAELDWRRIGEDFRPEAVKRVRRSLILEAIAKKEGLTVADVEVDSEIRRASTEQQRDFAEVKHRLKHDGGYEALRSSLAQEKALEFVLKAASLKSS